MKTLRSRLEQLEAPIRQARTRVFSDEELAIRMTRMLNEKAPGHERILEILANVPNQQEPSKRTDGGMPEASRLGDDTMAAMEKVHGPEEWKW